jgi:hypothetical protein
MSFPGVWQLAHFSAKSTAPSGGDCFFEQAWKKNVTAMSRKSRGKIQFDKQSSKKLFVPLTLYQPRPFPLGCRCEVRDARSQVEIGKAPTERV